MTQSKVKQIIQTHFISRYREPAKVNAVAKASAKFINKYKNAHYISVIDACLQMYSPCECLSTYLEKEKNLFI